MRTRRSRRKATLSWSVCANVYSWPVLFLIFTLYQFQRLSICFEYMLYTLIALLLWWQPLSSSSRGSQSISVGGSRSEAFFSLVRMSSKQSVKILPPRPLTAAETTHSLSQWKINFKQYCKKDDTFKLFLLSTTRWDFSKDNAGFTANEGTRTPQVLKEDLQDF